LISGQAPLTLDDAILLGLKNNFDIRIAKEDYNIAELNNKQGTVGRWPSIEIGVNSLNRYGNNPVFNPNSMGFGMIDQEVSTLTPYVELRWLLFDGLSVTMNKQKLDLLEQFSYGFSTIVIENTIQSIILGYYFALLENERLRVLKEVKDLSGDRYDYEMLRKDIGTSVTFDVLQAKNNFYSDSTNYLLQELNVMNAFLRLNLLLGEPPSSKFVLVDSFMVDYEYYDLDDMMDRMLSSNRNLKNQYVNQEILKKDISIAKADVWPTLSMAAGADYSQTWFDFEKHQPNTYLYNYYANFTLSFNLFNGGNTQRAIKSARISERIGKLEIAQLTQTLENLLVNQYELYGIRMQLLEVADVNLESAKLNLEIATDKYRNGTINSFNFRDVQLIFLNASSRKLNAIYDLIDSQTELLRLTGGIIIDQ
jgi:outer membrane protein TolC